jgi:hypothetical protein
MNDAQYIGLDVHQATISVAVLDCSGIIGMWPGMPSVGRKPHSDIPTSRDLADLRC